MSKTVYILRTYPRFHPREGQPTKWASAMLSSLGVDSSSIAMQTDTWSDDIAVMNDLMHIPDHPKHHQIVPYQMGEWSIGEKFIPQLSISPLSNHPFNGPVEVTRVLPLEIKQYTLNADTPDSKHVIEFWISGTQLMAEDLERFAKNEGFPSVDELKTFYWRIGQFKGYVIVWNPTIHY